MSIIRTAMGYSLYRVVKAFTIQNLILLVTIAIWCALMSVAQVVWGDVGGVSVFFLGFFGPIPLVMLVFLGEGEDVTMFWILTKFTGSAEVPCPYCGKPVTVPGCIANKADRIYARHIVHLDCLKSHFGDNPYRVLDDLYSQYYGFVVCEQISAG